MDNYNRFIDDMILRDHLALDRTVLANERTMLAYLRVFVGLMSAGVGMVAILDYSITFLLGMLFIVTAPIILAVGIVRCYKMKKKLSQLLSSVYNTNAAD